METRCPHCSRVQEIPDSQNGMNIRCEECRGMFSARQSKDIPFDQKVPDDGLPRFSHAGPGLWLNILAGVSVLVAVAGLFTLNWMLVFSGISVAISWAIFAAILNYLGYIARLLRHQLSTKETVPRHVPEGSQPL